MDQSAPLRSPAASQLGATTGMLKNAPAGDWVQRIQQQAPALHQPAPHHGVTSGELQKKLSALQYVLLREVETIVQTCVNGLVGPFSESINGLVGQISEVSSRQDAALKQLSEQLCQLKPMVPEGKELTCLTSLASATAFTDEKDTTIDEHHLGHYVAPPDPWQPLSAAAMLEQKPPMSTPPRNINGKAEFAPTTSTADTSDVQLLAETRSCRDCSEEILIPSDQKMSSMVTHVGSQQVGALSSLVTQAGENEFGVRTSTDAHEESLRPPIQPRKSQSRATGTSQCTSLFGDIANGMKDQNPLDAAPYDVSMYYKSTGCVQGIARSETFGNITLATIVANAIFLGIDIDHNNSSNPNKAAWYFILGENIFCAFFTFEWIVRFLAFARKLDGLKDFWFKFDSVLVFIMVLETWITPPIIAVLDMDSGLPTGPLRLLRLLRLARMVRLMRTLPELVTMVKGLFVATRAVGSSMLMLAMLCYAWGIAMCSLMKEEEDLFMYWGTLGRCMMTLISNGIFGDSIGTVQRGLARNPMALTCFFCFVILSAVTVTNMLIGVLCTVIQEVAIAEKESAAISHLKSTILTMLIHLDEDNSGQISRGEVSLLLKDQEALSVLVDLGVDARHFEELQDMHFETDCTKSYNNIMQLLLNLQGSKTATVKDLVDMHTFTRWDLRRELRRFQDKLFPGQALQEM